MTGFTAVASSSTARLTWNSGEVLATRGRASALTMSTNGTFWEANASSAVSRLRESSSRKLGLPASRERMATMFTKFPTTSSTPLASRFATEVPITKSRWVQWLASSTWYNASMAM